MDRGLLRLVRIRVILEKQKQLSPA
ncbi:uncharacterized protein METZ01_LOCUS464455, partial [marine metagenome]